MKSINAERTAQRIVSFLKKSFDDAGFSCGIVALSGGVDSATTLSLMTRAIGVENTRALLMPYGDLGKSSLDRALAVVQHIGLPKTNYDVIDIEPLLAPLLRANPDADDLRRGNMMARMRMTVLYDRAKKHRALVVGTENKSEHLLGYFTRFGDEASDIEPIKSLYKTHVYELARYLRVPDVIVEASPSAGLWSGQTDEGELGFTYAQADEIFYLTHDKKLPLEDVLERGFSKSLVDKVVAYAAKNDFKHHMPITIEISPSS